MHCKRFMYFDLWVLVPLKTDQIVPVEATKLITFTSSPLNTGFLTQIYKGFHCFFEAITAYCDCNVLYSSASFGRLSVNYV